MLQAIINWIKALFGFDKKPSKELQWLEKKASEQKKKLKEIDNENPSDSDIVDHFNK